MAIEFNKSKYYMSEDALLQQDECLTDRIIEEHVHDFIEIVYIIKGKCIHIVDGHEYKLRHGDILDKNKCKVSFFGDECDRFETIISILYDEIEQKYPGHDLVVYSQFNMLLLMIFRKMGIDIEDTFDGVSERLLNYIKRHCSEKLVLDDITKRCSYNPSYFSRHFKEYTGHSFLNYMKKIRMEKAVDMVLNGDMNITNIIYASGYSDATKFFRHFRYFSGISFFVIMKNLEHKGIK